MKWIPLILALSVAACTDDDRGGLGDTTTPPVADTVATDARAADTAQDVDTQGVGDTTPIFDTAPISDTTPPADTTPRADTAPPADTTPPADTQVAVDIAACPTPTMMEQYPGFLPISPWDAWPVAPACVQGEHDVIVVFGCPNEDNGEPASCQKERARIADRLAESGYGANFIVSGAAVHTDKVEAETLRDLLMARGVPSERIWLEPRAEHTDENIYWSTQIMKAQGWRTAMVVSEDPGHLLFSALCDSNCCVELGRLTLWEFPVTNPAEQFKAGHYVLYPDADAVSDAECTSIRTKIMCIATDGDRKACKDDFQLTP